MRPPRCHCQPISILGRWVVFAWALAISVGRAEEFRVATFNTSLFRDGAGDLVSEMGAAGSQDPKKIAEIIQRVRPDVILLNEFDYDIDGEALERFHTNFLMVSQGGQEAIEFPSRYVAESNTGISSCADLNNDGRPRKRIPDDNDTEGYRQSYAADCFGFGVFPGQYGMAVLSKFPVLLGEVRTFQKFLWKDMPGAMLPDIAGTPTPMDWYSEAEQEVFRLSSKSHWDLPIDVDGEIVHLLAAHPTPPTFDGNEDRNGLRNHDEIRLWADYILPGAGAYLYDDSGTGRGIGDDVRFVICGDYNADPVAGQSVDHAILQLLENPAVDGTFTPLAASGRSETSSFNLRVDYVLPSRAGFGIVDGAIFWPSPGQPGADLIGVSDHRLVWMDLRLTPLISEVASGLRIEIDGADVVVAWQAQPQGIAYGIECSGDLAAWTILQGARVELAGGQASFRDAGAATVPGRKHYRVTAEFVGE